MNTGDVLSRLIDSNMTYEQLLRNATALTEIMLGLNSANGNITEDIVFNTNVPKFEILLQRPEIQVSFNIRLSVSGEEFRLRITKIC